MQRWRSSSNNKINDFELHYPSIKNMIIIIQVLSRFNTSNSLNFLSSIDELYIILFNSWCDTCVIRNIQIFIHIKGNTTTTDQIDVV